MSAEKLNENLDARTPKPEEEEMNYAVQDCGLEARQLRAIFREIPEKYREGPWRVLAESVPSREKEGMMSYAGIWEIDHDAGKPADESHRKEWMVVDVLFGGLRNASTIKIENKNIAQGETDVVGDEKRSSVLIAPPQQMLNPLVMPRDIFLRLHRALAYKLIKLGAGYKELIELPDSVWFTLQSHKNPSTPYEAPHEAYEGTEPPKKSERESLLGDLGELNHNELERRHRDLGQ